MAAVLQRALLARRAAARLPLTEARRSSRRHSAASCRSMASARQAGEPHGAYMSRFRLEGRPDGGPLHGLTFVVKDSYDVQGYPTSNGSPEWLADHPPAEHNATAVQRLLDAGATLLGKCVMDEMAYSLTGENAHYGTPPNPAAPGRVPGGSSSGTASAVAAGDADLGLGGDTAGSVRVPASYCGLLGFRPTHGRVPLAGSVALAPSFDTGGWFARDAGILRRAGAVLLDPHPNATASAGGDTKLPSPRWLVATDGFALASPATSQALYNALSARMEAVRSVLGAPSEVEVAGGVEGGLGGWFDVFRTHQSYEVWRHHGPWVAARRPAFGPGIADRFAAAAQIAPQQFEAAAASRQRITEHMESLLGSDGVLALPSVYGPAPLLNTPAQALDEFRKQIICLTSVAGLAGLPQASLPIGEVDGCPVGLGLVGPRGSDERLLALAEALVRALE